MKKVLFGILSLALMLFAVACDFNPDPEPAPDPEETKASAKYKVEVSQDYVDVADMWVVYIANDGTSKTEKLSETTFTYEYSKENISNCGFAIYLELKSAELTKDEYNFEYTYELTVISGAQKGKSESEHLASTVSKENVSGYFGEALYPLYLTATIADDGTVETSNEAPEDGSLNLVK